MRVEYTMVVLAAGLVSSLDLSKTKLTSQRGHISSSLDKEQSLRSALDAVTRKQRSLDQDSSLDSAYYAESAPTSFKSFDQGAQHEQPHQQRKLHRQQVSSDGIGGPDDELAFIPLEGAGQQETIGHGYQHLNNRQLNRALLEYLYNTDQDQDDPQAQSVFRERANSPDSRKRSQSTERRRLTEEDLDRIFSPEGYLDDEEDPRQLDEDDYERTLDALYNDHSRQPEKLSISELQTLYRQILEDEALEQLMKEKQQEREYPRYMDRRNVHAHYPLFVRDYKNDWDTAKRFPVSKRSTKAAIKKRMIPDPKAGPGLGAAISSAHSPDHAHPHETETHDHDHSSHNHAHEKNEAHLNQQHNHTNHEAIEKGSKEIAVKTSNDKSSKDHSISVSKKSIDWSNYFGIDRRRKKSVYLGRPDTQDQDNEYLLQRYYETMAENLNPSGRDVSGKRDKMQQADSRLKNQMVDEAIQIGSQQDVDNQKVNDDIFTQLTTAYQKQMLRKALNELNAEVAANKHRMDQIRDTQSNHTQIGMGDVADGQHSSGSNARSEKRNKDGLEALRDDSRFMNSFDHSCPQLTLIERRCKASEALIGDYKEALQGPCIVYHICDTCGGDGCLERFILEAEWICREGDVENSPRARKHCMQSAMHLPKMRPPLASAALCFDGEVENCLGPHLAKYRGYFPGSSSLENR